MLISDEYKFIFVAVPKAASSAIEQALLPYGLQEKPRHMPARMIRDRVVDWDSYFRFALIRHPVDWLRSWHKFLTSPQRGLLPKEMSFSEFINGVISGDQKPIGRQANKVCSKRGDVLVSLYRFDCLAEQWPGIVARLKLPHPVALPIRNVSQAESRGEVSPELMAQIERHWAPDFELYGSIAL